MLLVPAYAVVVAAPAGPDQGCPSPRQTTEALMAHIPAVVVPADDAGTPGVLKLTVSGGGPIPLRIELTDQGGEARLYRSLTVAERSRAPDCPALADTVALIVERFLRDLGYEAPPSPPPPVKEPPRDNLTRGPPAAAIAANRFDVFAGGAWRGAPQSGESDFEAALGLGFERGVGSRRLAVTFSGGLSPSRSASIVDMNFQAKLLRIPIRIGLFMPVALGPGWLEPGLRLGVDWLFISATWGGITNSQMQASPGAELVVAYRMVMVRRLFARLGVSGGAALPYHVNSCPVPAGAPEPCLTAEEAHLFGQPRFYVKSGLELGFSFQ